MTSGSIPLLLVQFSLPLLIGNLFQQLYNTVDIIVVGNFVSKEALAAVGSVTPIINTLIGFFMGLSTGAGVVISQYFGAQDEENLSKSVHTSVTLSFVLCVVLSLTGVLATPFLLRMMQTPSDVFEEAALYLRIYFAGLSGLLLYNTASGILRSVGDSRRPLYFLIFSTIINILLDLLFVVAFGWGIAGVAWATVAAQSLSALLGIFVLIRSKESFRLDFKKLGMEKSILKKIFHIGIPGAVQMSLTGFSNVFVQSYINRFGAAHMAAWSCYTKLDQIAFTPMTSLSAALTIFTGQNVGAGDMNRAKGGTKWTLILNYSIFALVATVLMIFAPQLIALFNRDEEVVRLGTFFIRFITPFYVFPAMNQTMLGTLRGVGDTKLPTIFMMTSFILIRQIYLYLAWTFSGNLILISLGYPVGWMCSAVSMFLYYLSGRWQKNRTVVVE